MTANIDRAADVVYRTLSGKYGDFGHHEDVAQALAHDGYLMPDLPEPTRWKQNEEPEWEACDTTVSPAGHTGRVIVEDSDGRWRASAEEIRDLAYALLAAANYSERNQE